MNYKMKIQDKYIMPIKNRIKTKEYRLYDEERQKIKIGDVLLFAANKSIGGFVRVKVINVEHFLSWEDALKDSWKKQFEFAKLKYDEILNEMETYYDNKLVLKYGIVVFNIEPIVETIEKSKILLDIDIVIQHENGNNTGFENKSLYKWLEKLKVSKFIDSRSREEIIKNTKIKNEHIDKYFNAIISENADKFYTTVVKRYLSDSNKFVESMCLLPLYNGDIDYLITNNDDIVRQSIDLYLRDKVFTLAEFLFKVENDYKDLIDYDILSVKLKKFEEISIEDIFFDTLKEDYKEFDNWYKRKKDEKAYVFESM